MKEKELTDETLNAQAVERYEADNTSAIAIRSLDDISRISKIFIQSGMFKGDKGINQAQQVYQAGVKIIAGVEFGIQPFAAMRGINIIKGNAEMSANLMAAKVKKHPKYDYRVKQWDRDGCVLEFFEIPHPGALRKDWELLGTSSFDAEDAKIAGLAGGDNWRKFARNMYFARAMSNGVRIYTPDVFYGAPVYVEGEISGEFEETPTEPPQAKSDSGDQGENDAPPLTPPAKQEPVEAEVVEADTPVDDVPDEPANFDNIDEEVDASDTEEPALERQLESIATIAGKLGYGDDWVLDAQGRATTYNKAAYIIAKLKGEYDKREGRK
ncbi:hypothetical protein [Rhodococcus qingshengii]|uniref:hypothetical protein n=1 Tax=Rhodococcus qingshengii TaxID=334542 RepID=UPI002942F33C|nr:hypothetical protein [Rhodococcus qingshengii]WOI85960.1 hypothetical protein R0122_22535 [Rhodococcus qingshengii]